MDTTKQFFYLVLGISCLFISCKKPPTLVAPEALIIQPLPYLPCYPGSYWKYTGVNQDTVTYTTESEYRLVSLHFTDSIIIDPVKIPIYNGVEIFGYYQVLRGPYNFNIPGSPYSNSLLMYFSDELNKVWKEYTDIDNRFGNKNYHLYKVKEINTQIYNQEIGIIDSVVVINKTIVQNGMPTWYIDLYYAKNIGLVRMNIVDSISQVINTQLELQKYFINH